VSITTTMPIVQVMAILAAKLVMRRVMPKMITRGC